MFFVQDTDSTRRCEDGHELPCRLVRNGCPPISAAKTRTQINRSFRLKLGRRLCHPAAPYTRLVLPLDETRMTTLFCPAVLRNWGRCCKRAARRLATHLS